MRKRHLMANRDLIFDVRPRAAGVEPCLQVTCSCGLTAMAPVPVSERGKPFNEAAVLAAIPADEREAFEEFETEHTIAGHETFRGLVLVGI